MRKIFRYLCFLLCVFSLTVLPSCSPSAPEPASLSTHLEIGKGFSGNRSFTLNIPASLIQPGSDRAKELDALLTKRCPDALTFTKNNGDTLSYTFSLSFSSLYDYTTKLTRLMGSEPTVIFANPSTVMTTGWRIEEYFQSFQLLNWLDSAAAAEQLQPFGFTYSEPETTVRFNGASVKTVPTISVNRLSGSPVEKIQITTVNHRSTFDRTFVFTIAQDTVDELGSKLSDYFKSATDDSADVDWQLDSKTYIYTAAYTGLTLKQLEGFTNRILSSVYCDTIYLDNTKGSTPLAKQNSYTEFLDFSNYVGPDGQDVPVEYTYKIENDSQLAKPLVYSELEWREAEAEAGATSAVLTSNVPSLMLRITDGRQFIPQQINITLTPLDGENLSKTYDFLYPLEDSGSEASAYTAGYFENAGLSPKISTKDGCSVCSITFSGSTAELNAAVTDIFGDTNLISVTSSVPAMTLRTRKEVKDHVDLSSMLIDKNADTIVAYTIQPRDGEKAEMLSILRENQENPVSAEDYSTNTPVVLLGGKAGDVTAAVSVANWQKIIVFIVISVILVIIATTVIFLLRSKPLPQAPALESGKSALKPVQKKKKRTSAEKEKEEGND